MNQSMNLTNDVTEKNKSNVESFKYYFEDAYNFLKDFEKLNTCGFHIGTAENMHFFYIVLN